jgi:hypothetical protein
MFHDYSPFTIFNMPVLSYTNESFGQWPANHVPQPRPQQDLEASKLQTLLFNVVTAMLAAATLVVAVLHFRHQRKQPTEEQDRGMSR